MPSMTAWTRFPSAEPEIRVVVAALPPSPHCLIHANLELSTVNSKDNSCKEIERIERGETTKRLVKILER